MRARIRIHLPTLLWALVIAVGLLTPGPRLQRINPPTDWLAAAAHLVLFLVFAALLQRSLAREGVRRTLALSIGLAFLYGALLELAQVPVEGRSLEALDFVMNGLGAVLGAVAARVAS